MRDSQRESERVVDCMRLALNVFGSHVQVDGIAENLTWEAMPKCFVDDADSNAIQSTILRTSYRKESPENQ